MVCTRCDGTGFLHIDQVPDELQGHSEAVILKWVRQTDEIHDVAICDCCGDGENDWYGVPGYHHEGDDKAGPHGPYAGNGGLPRCN